MWKEEGQRPEKEICCFLSLLWSSQEGLQRFRNLDLALARKTKPYLIQAVRVFRLPAQKKNFREKMRATFACRHHVYGLATHVVCPLFQVVFYRVCLRLSYEELPT